jgi:hypothetical protein
MRDMRSSTLRSSRVSAVYDGERHGDNYEVENHGLPYKNITKFAAPRSNRADNLIVS